MLKKKKRVKNEGQTLSHLLCDRSRCHNIAYLLVKIKDSYLTMHHDTWSFYYWFSMQSSISVQPRLVYYFGCPIHSFFYYRDFMGLRLNLSGVAMWVPPRNWQLIGDEGSFHYRDFSSSFCSSSAWRLKELHIDELRIWKQSLTTNMWRAITFSARDCSFICVFGL